MARRAVSRQPELGLRADFDRQFVAAATGKHLPLEPRYLRPQFRILFLERKDFGVKFFG